jgi:hypothetical protein
MTPLSNLLWLGFVVAVAGSVLASDQSHDRLACGLAGAAFALFVAMAVEGAL